MHMTNSKGYILAPPGREQGRQIEQAGRGEHDAEPSPRWVGQDSDDHLYTGEGGGGEGRGLGGATMVLGGEEEAGAIDSRSGGGG